MPLVNPTLPNDGESADAGDISAPFLAVLAIFNGHIGADNIEPGTIPDAIGDGEIDTDKLAGNAVTTNKLADGSVTPAKVAPAVVVADATSNVITPLLSTRMYIVTALAGNASVAAPSGTPADGQALTLRIKATGADRALSWNAIYRVIGLTLPTTVVNGKTYYISMAYNAADTKYDVLSVARES